MGNSAVDSLALALGVVLAILIATALVISYREQNARRLWITGAVLAVVLSGAGMLDLMRATPGETHMLVAVFGAVLPVVGGIGVARMARRARWWIRWLLTFVTAFVLLFGGLLLGATITSRLLG